MIDALLEVVEGSDACSSLWLLLILLLIGAKIVTEHPLCRAAGQKAAVAVFVLYAGWRTCTADGIDAAGLIAIALRGILAGAFAAVILWIILPIVAHLHAFAAAVLVRPVSQLGAMLRTERYNRRAKRLATAERKRQEREYQLAEPQRQRARQEAEQAARAQATEQQRRDEARAACQMFYDLLAPDIGQRFTPEQFEKFAQTHLGDTRSADYVERRAAQLHDLLRQHLAKVEPLKFQTLDELRQWYAVEQKRIDALPEDALKRTLHVKLRTRFSELANDLLEEAMPLPPSGHELSKD